MSENDHRGAGVPPDVRARLGSDFSPRLVSALAMGAVVALFTFTGAVSFAVLVVVVTMLLSWEWGRLVHGREADVVVGIHVVTTGLAAVLAAFEQVGLGLLVLPIGAILALVLSLGRNSLMSALGVFYAGLPAVALIWLRADGLGLLAVVYLILIVITSDTAGFLAGRLLGGPKLWARLSPNKTWAGAIGALVACFIVGGLYWFAVPDASPVRLAGVGAMLSLVAQAGDLLESGVKRRFGAKDTSTLIPGHGGVMDRVDGLGAAAAAVGLMGFIVNVHAPAYALLMGP
jgi:phosphatidate cytidylyltransferase